MSEQTARGHTYAINRVGLDLLATSVIAASDSTHNAELARAAADAELVIKRYSDVHGVNEKDLEDLRGYTWVAKTYLSLVAINAANE